MSRKQRHGRAWEMMRYWGGFRGDYRATYLVVCIMVGVVWMAVSCNRRSFPSTAGRSTVGTHSTTSQTIACPSGVSYNHTSTSASGGVVRLAEPPSPLDSVRWPPQSWANPGEGLLGAIYRHQNPMDCNNARYIIWRFPRASRDARNIGALYSTLQAWLAFAIQTDRILVFDDRNWKLTDERCEHRSTQCYFRPVSACYPPLEPASSVSLRKAKDVNEVSDDVQVIEFEGSWWPLRATKPFKVNISLANGGDGPGWEMVEMLSKPRTMTRWMTAALQYFWRPSSTLTEKIEHILSQLNLSSKIIPRKTIAMPVRASDKCHGHKVEGSAPGEEDCLTLEHYMERANEVREKDPEVDTIIFTSESKDMVNKSSQYSKSGRWRFVYNDLDVMPGTGSTNEETLKKSTTKSLGIEGALVSLHMLLRAKYFILPYSPRRHRVYSSWLHSVGGLSRSHDLTFVDVSYVVDVHRGVWYSSIASDDDLKR
ncbi:hypothetical protein AAMO2058_000631700 [Amorphochlora amoebiformis]